MYFHHQNLQISLTLSTQSYRLLKLLRTFRRSMIHTLNFSQTLLQFCFKNVTSHQVLYSDLEYKLRRVKGAINFTSLSWKIVRRIGRWHYSLLIIKRTTYVLWWTFVQPCYGLYKLSRSFCTLIKRLFDGSWSSSLLMAILASFSPLICSSFQMGGAQPTYVNNDKYFWYCFCMDFYYIFSLKEVYSQILKVCVSLKNFVLC